MACEEARSQGAVAWEARALASLSRINSLSAPDAGSMAI
jgi:hypothetical protein